MTVRIFGGSGPGSGARRDEGGQVSPLHRAAQLQLSYQEIVKFP